MTTIKPPVMRRCSRCHELDSELHGNPPICGTCASILMGDEAAE